MPLEPYQQYQPTTPDATPSPRLDCYGHGRNFSTSSSWSTPDSILSAASATTHLTTPSASPQRSVSHNNILPKIRTQDQTLEPDYYGPSSSSLHRRAQSHDIDTYETTLCYRPGYQRSTTSPPDFSAETTPFSGTSTFNASWIDTAADDSPLAYSVIDGHESLGHGRSISTSSVDPSVFRPVGNPYYRTVPKYVTQESLQSTTPAYAMPDYMPFQTPSEGIDQSLPYELLLQYRWQSGDDPNDINTINNYLTERNPTVYSIPEAAQAYGDGKGKCSWWDVRNIRPWDDFKLTTMSAAPTVNSFVDLTMKGAAFPPPAPLSYSAINPQDLCTLANTLNNFHIAKVNAALKAMSPANHMTMTLRQTHQDGYYFVSTVADGFEHTLDNRARVIGLVKPYERWNSGKRRGDNPRKVEYLQHLAHLQLLMRQHNCRYGFIITEIELVCVRLGTNPGSTPYFGFLELSRPIAMTTSRDSNLNPEAGDMSVGLALWYLNVAARDGQSFGQPSYRIDVGPPEALTRSHVLRRGKTEGRDSWMPPVQQGESRRAKTTRGWAWPDDPIHRQKEGVGSSRAKKR